MPQGLEAKRSGQREEVAKMSGEVGSKLATLGCAIAVLSVVVGVIGVLESVHHWHLENLQAYLGLAFGGGIIGLIIAIFGKTGKE